MLTLDAVRAAVLADHPWTRLDELVRAEMAAGQRVRQIYEALASLSDGIDDTPGLTDDGSDAFGDTLDALTGMCHPDCQYTDPPAVSPDISEARGPTAPLAGSHTAALSSPPGA